MAERKQDKKTKLIDITRDYQKDGVKGFGYPFSCVDDFRSSMYHPIVGKDMKTVHIKNVDAIVKDFPHNVRFVYYFEVGKPDYDQWRLVGILKNGLYFYYDAGCDYTGFDCQGSMRLYLSDDFDELADKAMHETVREHVYRFQHMRSSVDDSVSMSQYNARSKKFDKFAQ